MFAFVQSMPKSQKALCELVEVCRELPEPHRARVGTIILDLMMALSSEARIPGVEP